MPPDVQCVEIGGQRIVFIDDFLEDPQGLQDAACLSPFEPPAALTEHKGYPGLRAPAPAAYTQPLTEVLDPLVKVNFQVLEALDVKVGLSAFSLTTVAPDQL